MVQHIEHRQLEKRERIELFIQKLKKENKVFDNAQDVHRHLRKSLQEIEDEHAQWVSPMSVLALSDFELIKEEKLYLFHARMHTIFIRINGAYGIYDNVVDYEARAHSFYFEQNYYKKVIEFPNKYGITLFPAT